MIDNYYVIQVILELINLSMRKSAKKLIRFTYLVEQAAITSKRFSPTEIKQFIYLKIMS